jgi:hypothetical protein
LRRLASPLSLVAVFVSLLPCPLRADIVRHSIAPGIVFEQQTISPPEGPLVVNVVRVDPKAPGVKIEAALGKDVVLTDDKTRGRETVGELAVRRGAAVAINADFFPFTGDPLGIAIRNGELLSEPMPHRVAMALTPDGQALFDTLLPVGMVMGGDRVVGALDGINRMPAKDEIVLLTPAFGAKVRASATMTTVKLASLVGPVRLGQEHSATVDGVGRTDPDGAIPTDGAALVGDGRGAEWLRAHMQPGEQARFRFDLVSNPLPTGPRRPLPSRAGAFRGKITKSAWADASQAVGGGPWLVRGSKVAVDGPEEGFADGDFTMARHPRTAAGVTASGELLLVTVDGRQSFSRGLSLPDLAQLMIRLGAVNAINLDGGGSTSMVVNGLYVNGPSDGEPRPIATALLVFADTSKATGDNAEVICDPLTLRAGDRVAFPIAGAGLPPVDPSLRVGRTLWGTILGTGFVDQGGQFVSKRAGSSAVVAMAEGKRVLIPVTVLPGAPSTLKASLLSSPNNPPDRNQIAILVTDAFGNGVPGQAVKLQVSGGIAEKAEVLTDERGRAVLEVVWDVEKGRKVLATSGSLTASTAK